MAEILSESKKWELTERTIHGEQSPASVTVAEGKICFSAEPIPKGAKPNLALLAEILRSEEPLPRVAREWLANLFEPQTDTKFYVKELHQNRRGQKAAADCNHWDAAQYALLREECGDRADDPNAPDGRPDKRTEAARIAGERFGISPSAVRAAIKSYLAARELHDKDC